MTAPYDRSFFGHPRGLATLFFTEMWERFSYYGMRALLILFMTAPVSSGGLGFDTAVAGAVYGLYTSMVYMTSLPGGWIADRLTGPRLAVLLGGIGITAGNMVLALSTGLPMFCVGLLGIVLGVGLLKPNVSAIVADLYPEGGARLDHAHGGEKERDREQEDRHRPEALEGRHRVHDEEHEER